MKNEQHHWNQTFAELETNKPVYDDWLDKHSVLLGVTKGIPIIDLGCGVGCDTLYLTERGYKVISCDLSDEALQRVRRNIPEAVTQQLNLLEPLPFDTNSAQVIIADLSLHYFSWDDTVAIVSELKRVLKSGGSLLCRLNSVNDTEFGAGQGVELEPHYYEHKGRRKRFFDEADVDRLFQNWKLGYKQEAVMDRYRKPKRLLEISAINLSH
jgi:SAM-dependent methyltransferase